MCPWNVLVMQKCYNLAHVRVIKVEFPRPPQNSPEMPVTIMQSWCVFSIFNHIMKLANGPVVISKMEHLDPWPKAGGWQREVVFSSFNPLLLATDLDEPSGAGAQPWTPCTFGTAVSATYASVSASGNHGPITGMGGDIIPLLRCALVMAVVGLVWWACGATSIGRYFYTACFYPGVIPQSSDNDRPR